MKATETKKTASTVTSPALVLNKNQLDAIASSRFSALKSKELALAGIELDRIANSVTREAVAQCKVYFDVQERKLYEEDGLKSVADFAEKYFGESKSSASQKATVYKRFFSDTVSDTCKAIHEAIGDKPAVLYELSKLTDEELSACDTSAFKGMTLDKARALAKDVKAKREDGKTKPVKTFDVIGYSVLPHYDRDAKEYDVCRPVLVCEGDVPLKDDMDVLSVISTVTWITPDTKDVKVFNAKFEDVNYKVVIDRYGAVSVLAYEAHKKPEKKSEPVIPTESLRAVSRMLSKGLDANEIAEMLDMDYDRVEFIISALKK